MRRALCCAAMVAVAVAVLGRGLRSGVAHAAPIPTAGYSGITSEFGTMGLGISADGRTLSFGITFQPQIAGCPSSVSFPRLPVSAAGIDAGGLTDTALRNISITVRFGGDYLATGSFSADSIAAQCPSKRVSWSARVNADGWETLGNAGAHSGVAIVPDGAGAVSFRIPPGGAGMQDFSLSVTRGACEYRVRLPADWNNSNAIFLEPGAPVLSDGWFLSSFTPGGAKGLFVAIGSRRDCGAIAGYFVADRPAALDPRLLSGTAPTNGGVGTVVFGGGSFEQLVRSAGCAPEGATFWASELSGSFVRYLPGAGVALVNAEWAALFPTGIVPPETVLLAACR